MILPEAVVGTRTAATMRERASAPLLLIGGDTFTRQALSAIECYSDRAAVNLSHRIKQLKVKNTRDLFEHVAPIELIAPRLGSFGVAVLGAAFQIKGLGTLKDWAVKHLPAGAKIVTVDTLKERDAKEHADERKRLKLRKTKRRDIAHRYRLTRFQRAS